MDGGRHEAPAAIHGHTIRFLPPRPSQPRPPSLRWIIVVAGLLLLMWAGLLLLGLLAVTWALVTVLGLR